MDLNVVWFFLIGFLLVGYSILDGFDLGTGILQLFTRTEEDKRALLRAIAPFWDGNEVWLITGGGAIFAAFPHVYATVFSGFYLALILLLVGLIFRALSIEFRDQVESVAWKSFWDKAFSVSSLIVTLLLGVALGNIYIGIPLDDGMNYTGSFFTLLRPIPLAIGLTGVFMICTQGSAYLLLKTEKKLHRTVQGWVRKSWILFTACTILMIILISILKPLKIITLFSTVYGFLAIFLLCLGIVLLPYFLKKEYDFRVFLSSSLIILSMFSVVAATIFPNIVPAQFPEYSLTIYNASSSQRTLFVMLIIALIGMPLVLVYSAVIYRVFRK